MTGAMDDADPFVVLGATGGIARAVGVERLDADVSTSVGAAGPLRDEATP